MTTTDDLDDVSLSLLGKMEEALKYDPYPTLPSSRPIPKAAQAPESLASPTPSTSIMPLPPPTLRLLQATTGPEFFQALEKCKATEVQGDITAWEMQLTALLQTSDEIDDSISALRERLSCLLELNGKVKSQSEGLSAGATSLLAHKEKLERSLQSTEHKLNFFFDVDSASNTIHIPQMSPFHDTFLRAVQKLDDGERFFLSHKHYNSAPTYINRVGLAKQKALTLLRDAITNHLNLATQMVMNTAQYHEATRYEGKTAVAESQDTTLDVSVESAMVGNVGICTVLNVEFLSKLHDVLPLLAMLQERCRATTTSGGGQRDVRVILESVVSHYITSRVKILRPLLSEFVSYLQRNLEWFPDPPQLKHLASGGVTYLLALSIEESVLLASVWNPTNTPATAASTKVYLTSIVEAVSQEVYDAYRSGVLREDDIKALCFLVDCLQVSLLEGKVKSAGEVGKFVSPVIQRMIEDTQERLYFRSNMYVKDVLTPFTYTLKDAERFLYLSSESTAEKGIEPFPPLENCLYLLSMLYNALAKDVFCGIAEEAMRVCVGHTQRLALIVRNSSNTNHSDLSPNPVYHSLLFSLRLFLRLREQIAPFDVSFRVMERGLDVASLVRTRNVSIVATARDAKKLLEDEIRGVCEEFMKLVTQDLGKGLRKFLDELARVPSPAPPAMLTGFTSNVVAEVMQRAHIIHDSFLKRYIANAMTCAVLWKPIMALVQEEYKRVHTLLVDTFGVEETKEIPNPNAFIVSLST